VRGLGHWEEAAENHEIKIQCRNEISRKEGCQMRRCGFESADERKTQGSHCEEIDTTQLSEKICAAIIEGRPLRHALSQDGKEF